MTRTPPPPNTHACTPPPRTPPTHTLTRRCREMLRNSPTALRLLKAALNAAEDGQAGIQQLGGDATLLFYQSEEGNEGRQAYLEKRPPDFSRFPRLP